MDGLGDKRVLISDSVDECCAKILREYGFSVVCRPGLSKEELLSCIKDFDGLIVRSATKVTAEVIQAAKQLKVIGRAGTGVDNIDLDAATAHGIAVINTPAGNSISAAEHTCALISSLARSIPQAHMNVKSGKWDRKKYMGVELQGKTLAIIGLGRIGREVATRMQSFGMKTIGYDPLVPAAMAEKFGVAFYKLEDIWPEADFITVHTPLIPSTKGLLNKNTFAKCRQGVCVINAARGGIYDEQALLDALESGQCGGAALDVFEKEPPTDQALLSHEKVVVTPHLGANTKEAQLKVAEEIAQLFVAVAEGKPVAGLVNAPALASSSQPGAAAWVTLSRRLAAVLHAVDSTTSHNISVTVGGKALEGMQEAVLAGVLQGMLPGQCNSISAKATASKKNVQFSLNLSKGEEKVKVECGSHSVEGKAIGGQLLLTGLNGECIGVFEVSGSVAVGKLAALGTVSSGEVTGMVAAGDIVLLRLRNGISPPDTRLVKW